jgi:hypothetical protein
MTVKFKQQIKDKLGNVFKEKGFELDESSLLNSNYCIVYSKGEPEPSIEVYEEKIDKGIDLTLKRGEIIIHRSRWQTELTVELRNLQKVPSTVNLWMLSGENTQKWWSFDCVEKFERAISEIIDLMNKYGWEWLQLN